MKAKYDFRVMEIAGELIAVPVGKAADEFRGILRVNSVTSRILELLKSDTDEEHIVMTMQQEYNASGSQISESVHNVLDTLRVEGLLEE